MHSAAVINCIQLFTPAIALKILLILKFLFLKKNILVFDYLIKILYIKFIKQRVNNMKKTIIEKITKENKIPESEKCIVAANPEMARNIYEDEPCENN